MRATMPTAPTPHWAEAYIGAPWVPQSNDCWAFCRRVWAERFGIDVPVVEIDVHSILTVARAFHGHVERGNWQPVTQPAEGDAVLLSHTRYPSHVGIWLDADGGGVLHCQQGIGVIFSRPDALAKNGWGRLSFYRHASKREVAVA